MRVLRQSGVYLTLIALVCAAFHVEAQENNNSAKIKVTLAGILLVSDYRCDEARLKHLLRENRPFYECPDGDSQWGLLSGSHVFKLYGDATELGKYERTRVSVTGSADGGKVFVDSIVPAVVPDTEIRRLVEQLRNQPWHGAQNISNPTFWVFNFTGPMTELLEAGPSAQDILLQHLDDTEIKDQIILLLGGIGDEKVIEPIIHAMVDRGDHFNNASRINLAANLALTNLTQGEVIWHHGGGITIDACPDDPKSCWYAWWVKNRDNFKVAEEYENRSYSNYPNYGIYHQP